MGTNKILNGRNVGQYDLSMATSMAIEGAMGIHPDHPTTAKTPPLLKYDELWINIRTLFRNIRSSMFKSDDKDKSASISNDPTVYTNILFSEIATIDGLIPSITNKNVKANFYICQYDKIKTYFPYANIRADSTAKQKEYSELELKVINSTIKSDNYLNINIAQYEVLIKTGRTYNSKNVLIFTNLITDLLAKYSFNILDLLESHTGVIKSSPIWYTKLNGGNNLNRIPFNKMTMQMFGDSTNPPLFKSQDFKFKKELLDIAEKNKWNPTTTKERILLGVNSSGNAELYSLVKNLF